MAIQLVLLGFISILGQVVILRELVVAYYGIELIYLIAIGVWLIGTGWGAMLGRKRIRAHRNEVLWLFLLMALLLPLDVILIRGIRYLLGGVSGAYLSFPLQLCGIAITILPLGLLLGLLFQRCAKAFVESGKSLAKAYGIESAGSVFGGIASTGLLYWGMQNITTVILTAYLAAVYICWETRKNISLLSGLAYTLCLGLTLMLLFVINIDYRTTGWNHQYLLSSRDTPYGRVSIVGHEGQISVFENDALSFETEGTSAEELAHLVALQHPNPKRVLVLGGGIEGTVYELQKHHPQQIDYVELNQALIADVIPLLGDSIRASLQNNRTNLIFGDPRQSLSSLGKYDLILAGMADPNSAQANRYYTADFFKQVKQHLNSGGVIGFRLRSAENFWTEQLTLRNASVFGALKSVFPATIVLPGTTNIIITGETALTSEPDTLVERFRDRGITARLVSPPYIHYLYTNDRFREIAKQLQTQAAPINSDDQPVCFHFAVSIWLSKFFPQLLASGSSGFHFFDSVKSWIIPLSALLLGGFFFSLRKRERAKGIVIVGGAGFCGMLLETILILRYQIKSGVLYQDLGLLLTMFMLGLAVGAIAVDKYFDNRKPSLKQSRLMGSGLMLFFALLGLLVWLSQCTDSGGIMATGILLMLSGVLVAAVFAYISLTNGTDRNNSISALYGADLIGGACGTLMGSILIVPIIGIAGSGGLVVLIALVSILLVK